MITLGNQFVDRAIGADGLGTAVREKLMAQQLETVSRSAPYLFAASLIVSIVFLLLALGTPVFPVALAILVPINFLHAHGAYWAVLRPDAGNVNTRACMTVLHAALAGCLWAVLMNFVQAGLTESVHGAVLVSGGGLFCISILALLIYPQAMAAFVIPMAVGLLSGLDSLGNIDNLFGLALLLTGFTFIVAVISLNHAASFVARRVSELLVQEKSEIIGLLLREFERTSSDWIWGFDEAGDLNRISDGFTQATGVTEEALVGADFVYFLRCITPPDDPLVNQIEEHVQRRATFQDIELLVTADGQTCWWTLTGKPVFDEAGAYLGYLGTGSDITERKVAERRITLLAHHDSMTGLLNRGKFTEQLSLSVARLERYGTPFSVIFLDLDQFKAVNDTRGHMVGDRLLVQIARRIEEQVRETDLVARLGGDEFAILLPNDANRDGLADLAYRLIEAIRDPVVIEDEHLSIGASIGIAMAPINGTRPDQLLRNADLALYRAKADGRSVFRFFESQMDSEAREKRLLEAELRDAIGNGELVLHYQPLVDAENEQPMGFEALIRWDHPIRGLVPPAEFIPVAEQSSLIVDIGDWTIETACLAAADWPDHLTVAVNLSAKHFRRSDIKSVLQKALTRSGLAPHRLEIEITEGLLIEDPDDVIDKLSGIRDLGVTIAMDDFGTGYSSLGYLLKFPFDKIKIDRSFVEASASDEVARDILRAITSLGRTLKLKITAEGVETAEQAAFLSEIACHQLQGFHFARPLDSIDLPHYLLSMVPTQASAVKAEAEKALIGS
ncbi:MAG: EAL domain-containing protein [Devosia sp.]|uniref:putative bifunctional diguanylate cyclase/phosphodiesterase n=1 Tax=Devosia sp. TaxID=1871048 RepID=UPI0024C7C9AE|nr:bifunctional diguanylate cyclase/phosphodiesterase [Devosia sp.]UYO01151.1 MAG: EAL domain-containing protein [Devosia sp.]